MLPWAVEERVSRNLTERGYDDPTAHCFPPGVPRAMYVPAAMHIIQTPDYIVFLHERMAWRYIHWESEHPGIPHLPETMRLWQGDSVGRWEGDTLVVDTTNLNGKTWLNEGGEIVSYAEHVVERYTPVGPDTLELALRSDLSPIRWCMRGTGGRFRDGVQRSILRCSTAWS